MPKMFWVYVLNYLKIELKSGIIQLGRKDIMNKF